MIARNTWNSDFDGRVAFADLAGARTGWTGDRTEFLGRHGALDQPAGMERGRRLSGRVGAGLDPCSVLQTMVELRAGERVDVVFLLGEAASHTEAAELVVRYRAADLDAVLRSVTARWDEVLSAVQVRTPDRSLDILLNGWLLYQTLACRVWARAAFYQAGGAYGFRDQLQDVMALSVASPQTTREHLLRAAGRQFVEGDVQHWWHPPTGRGVRTRISDDPVWLPYAVADYLEVTGDIAVLDEVVPFLDGPMLAAGQAESYFQPGVSPERATLFEHCARALDRSLGVGDHGLPLIGTGDWNDGMNRVGQAGRGESIWLGWFFHAALSRFAAVADGRGEGTRATGWREHARRLKTALEEHGWDGRWYRRAYFDDGTPLGSAVNAECRIDSIAQSWGVISAAAEPSRAVQGMAAVEGYLVRRDEGLILLFAPPFDGTILDPGYIKAYPPGIRENGGQYTHAAIWSVIALAALGEGDKAHELMSFLNPVHRSSRRSGADRYKVEPYIMVADVYAEPAHVGRGGWTWYTGSAGWMYRAGIEWLLGFRVCGSFLHLDPCIPHGWPGFEITFRYRASRYELKVDNPLGAIRGIADVEVDGVALLPWTGQLPLVDDGATHQVRIVLGERKG
jgi:cyclic beta-1,2-glucan synthetase